MNNLGKKTNRVYKSDSEVIRIPGGIPAIVDAKLFDEIQNILDQRKRRPMRRGLKSKYLLTGLVKCGYCECSLSGQYTFSGKTKAYRSFYACNKNQVKPRRCKCKDINMEYLNWYIKNLLTETILNKENIKIFQDGVNELSSYKRQIVSDRLTEIENEKLSIKEKSLEYAELLAFASENEYVRLMKEISNITARRTSLELMEIELDNKIKLLPRLTVKDIKGLCQVIVIC